MEADASSSSASELGIDSSGRDPNKLDNISRDSEGMSGQHPLHRPQYSAEQVFDPDALKIPAELSDVAQVSMADSGPKGPRAPLLQLHDEIMEFCAFMAPSRRER